MLVAPRTSFLCGWSQDLKASTTASFPIVYSKETAENCCCAVESRGGPRHVCVRDWSLLTSWFGRYFWSTLLHRLASVSRALNKVNWDNLKEEVTCRGAKVHHVLELLTSPPFLFPAILICLISLHFL